MSKVDAECSKRPWGDQGETLERHGVSLGVLGRPYVTLYRPGRVLEDLGRPPQYSPESYHIYPESLTGLPRFP